MLRIRGNAGYRQYVQVAGIRPAERMAVSSFAKGLHYQKGLAQPTFDPDPNYLADKIAQDWREILKILMRDLPLPKGAKPDNDRVAAIRSALAGLADKIGLSDKEQSQLAAQLAAYEPGGMPAGSDKESVAAGWLSADLAELAKTAHDVLPAATGGLIMRLLQWAEVADLPIEKKDLAERFWYDVSAQIRDRERLLSARQNQQVCDDLRKQLQKAQADKADDAALDAIRAKLDAAEARALRPPEDRIILGLGIPALSFRTDKGEYVRAVAPGDDVDLTVFQPITSSLDSPNRITATVVDDCRTDVYNIDSELVYIPFDTLQRLNNMAAETGTDGSIVTPARCSQLHIKVKLEYSSTQKLDEVKARIDHAWARFVRQHPRELATSRVTIETWQERQRNLIEMIASQRTLSAIMVAIVSVVCLLLIFVLFYTIVVQKTKDIGIIKSLGASSPGVAQIFLAYGACIGVVGGILGTIIGYVFVWNVNAIQDWVGDNFGFRVWKQQNFMFDKIPNEVDARTALLVFVVAILASMVSTIYPAIRAARMQPVESLRYE
jgi:ABC-type lipoprotein release transport system permease subunit